LLAGATPGSAAAFRIAETIADLGQSCDPPRCAPCWLARHRAARPRSVSPRPSPTWVKIASGEGARRSQVRSGDVVPGPQYPYRLACLSRLRSMGTPSTGIPTAPSLAPRPSGLARTMRL
jgi:hypothetical protein